MFLEPLLPLDDATFVIILAVDIWTRADKQVKDGSNKIPVGQVIAILAEEGDDLASIEIPSNLAPEGQASSSGSSEKKEEKSAPKVEQETTEKKAAPAPASEPKQESSQGHGHGHKVIKHSKPLFPSVSRLYVLFLFYLYPSLCVLCPHPRSDEV